MAGVIAKAGQKVKVISLECGHGFSLGEIAVRDSVSEDVFYKLDRSNFWYLNETLYDVLPMELETWEVAKLALEKPETIFQRVDQTNSLIYKFIKGEPMFKYPSNTKWTESSDLLNLNYKWKVYTPPVSFDDAVKSGKKIKPEKEVAFLEDYMELYEVIKCLYALKNEVIQSTLLGKWFVQPE